MIAQATINEIQEIPTERVISTYLTVKPKTSGRYSSVCPFHEDSHPSLIIYPDNYHCPVCGAHGYNWQFVANLKNISFIEAIQEIAKDHHIPINYESRTNGYTPEQQKAKQDEKTQMYEALEKAQSYFESQLPKVENYLLERQFSKEIIAKFGLGYAPEGFYFTNQKNPINEKVDLVAVSKEDKRYDFLRNRITIPLHDTTARIIGYAGRLMPSDNPEKDKELAKYINSTTKLNKEGHSIGLYHKSKYLYGLLQAKKSIIKENKAFLVEGYPNVWRLHQEGILNVVAAGGTALTAEQIKLLKSITKNLVLCYDGDNAGIKAINRNLPLLLKEGFNVSILPIPTSVDNPKMDIDDLGRYFRSFFPYRGWGNNLMEYIEYMTKTWVEYKIQAFAIEGKKDKVTLVEFAGHLTDLILSHPDKVYQEMFINEANNRVLFLKTTYKAKLKEQKEAEKSGEKEEVVRVIFNEEETKVINARGVLATIGNFQIKILYKIAIPNSEDCKWFLEIKRKNQEAVTLIVDNKEFKPQNLEMLLYAKDFSLDLDDKQFKYLKDFLQKEGYRKCLEVKELGYHPKSQLFFFSNCAYHTITKKIVYPNSLNIIDLEDISYLMPYVNREFSTKDKIACYYEEGTIGFEQVADFIMRSWGENAVLPIAYYFASLFMDIAISRNKSFPVLFLKGEGSTGKTKLANLLMDFYGTDMSKEVGLAARSSAYALKDRMSFFSNIPVHVEDYSRAKDLEEMDNFVVHLYDRKFRKTKDMGEKNKITDEIPLSSMIATSNDDPRDDGSGALPSRLIYIKITGNNHDTDAKIAFEKGLADIEKHQRAHITIQFLQHRQLIEKHFDSYFMDFLQKLSNRLQLAQIHVPNRVITGYCAIITPMSILGDNDIVNLPDGIPTHVKLSDALLDIAYKNIVRQVNSLLSKSPLQTFWETVQGLADEANYQISRVGTYINSKGEEKPKDVNINNRLIYKDYHYKVWQFHDKGTIRVIDEPVVRLKFQDIYDKYFLKMKERGETKIPSALHIKDLLRNHRSYVPDVSETQLKYKDDGQSSPVKMGFILKYNALKDDFDVDFE